MNTSADDWSIVRLIARAIARTIDRAIERAIETPPQRSRRATGAPASMRAGRRRLRCPLYRRLYGDRRSADRAHQRPAADALA
jgi:hypothetical protein